MTIPVSPSSDFSTPCYDRPLIVLDARALFEKSALNIPAEKARPLWDAWARYEYMYGDLATVTKLEARFSEAFPNGRPTISGLQV